MTQTATNTVFSTKYPIDKIVQVFQDKYNLATDVYAQAYTFGGLPITVNQYKIPHNFKRPLFVEYLWSLDNITYFDGPSGVASLGYTSEAWSDSNYIYLRTPTLSSGTAYYKIICSWIDNYDSTILFVNPQNNMPKGINFDSRLNYQKIFDQRPLTFNTASAGLTTVIQTVTHNLGYSPNCKLFLESFPGQVWPMNFGDGHNINYLDDSQMQGRFVSKTNTVDAIVSIKASMGNRRVWSRIYLDQ